MEDAGCSRLRLFIAGYPLEYTLSPAIYHAWARMRGLRLEYGVERPSEPAGLAALAEMCRRDACCRGFNVTMPYKTVVLSMLQDLDEHSRIIEAVNTVVNHDGSLIGYNTDWIGVRQPLDRAGYTGGSVLIIGAGGAARAAAYALRDLAETIYYTSRTGDSARKLAEWTRRILGVYSEGYKATKHVYKALTSRVNLVINASPASGVDKTPLPLDTLSILSKPCTVFDMVYKPVDTLLLQEARKTGCKTVDGLDMLSVQAAYNIKVWFNIDEDPALLKRTALEAIGQA